MKKERYERTYLDVIEFKTADVIATTGEGTGEPDELPFVPAGNNQNMGQ